MENEEKEKGKEQEADSIEKRERAHACSKSELAQRYLPHVSPPAARRMLRAWIDKNADLKAVLEKTGYDDKTVMLTPAQVQLHYDYLGEP